MTSPSSQGAGERPALSRDRALGVAVGLADRDGRDYYRGKRAAGKKPQEAIRCLKRRISDTIYKQLVADALRTEGAAREGTAGRLKNPARSIYPRESTLRISHSRTRTHDATPHPHRPGRAHPQEPSKPPVDNRGEPVWAHPRTSTVQRFSRSTVINSHARPWP